MIRAALIAGGIAFSSGPASASCEIALALALDISSSVNAQEYEVQKGGLARALRDPAVREAVLVPPGGVALIAYEWSGWQQQDVIADWSLIQGEADLDAFVARIDTHQREYAEFSTAIGRALLYGAELFDRLPYRCGQHVIDVSGDGVNNEGVAPGSPRVRARLAGVTVNALVIGGATPPPAPYYRNQVITGPGAFMMVARNGFDDYPELIRGKLLKELQQVLYIGNVQSETETR